MSVVIPERTAFTERPRSANPPRKNASPERPIEVLSSGTSSVGPESEPVGISIETLEGRGSIIARAESWSSSLVGAWSTLMLRGLSPAAEMDAVPLPAEPDAPSSRGGSQLASDMPEILDEIVEVPSLGS